MGSPTYVPKFTGGGEELAEEEEEEEKQEKKEEQTEGAGGEEDEGGDLAVKSEHIVVYPDLEEKKNENGNENEKE